MPTPWFIVSKPLRAPFRDGSTVLIRDLIARIPRERPLVYFGDPRSPLRRAPDTVLDLPPMGYAPGLWAKLRVLLALLHPRRRALPVHLCFTPNPITSRALALLRWFQPRRIFVQSLMSAHGCESWVALLRPLDAVIVLSDHTRQRLITAGLDPEKIHRIYPAVATVPADLPEQVAARKRLLYAGDLDLDVADRLIHLARLLDHPEHPEHPDHPTLAGWTLTIACRPKAATDAAARDHLRRALADLLASGRVHLLAEVADMDALLRSASLQLYAADHVRRKVDLPLVLLEGLARGVPLVTVDAAPVRELFTLAATHGLLPGALAPADPPAFARAVAHACQPAALRTASAAAAHLATHEFSLDRLTRSHVALHVALEQATP